VAIDWEHWVGVRGAAVLGGVVLALAGLYFFQYSIEHGLVPPWLRVVSGTLVGLACIVGAELKARQRYATTANALIGGGVVILYAAFWAARSLYGLIGTGLAFPLMIAVTGAGTALAYRHASLVIAMIGLIGGFLTPLLLSTGEDRPIALFAYLLLLDAGLLFMAQRRGWPLLAFLSLLGTVLYQVLWIGTRMDPDQVFVGLCVLGIFALAYAFALRKLPAQGRREWLITQGGGALLPFLFAIYVAGNADFGEHFTPVALLLALLSASAAWLGRAQQRAWLGLGAAAGTTAVFAAWLLGHEIDGALAWEAAALCLLLAAIFHVFVELDREPPGRQGPAPAAMLAALGLQALLVAAAAATDAVPLWPWLAGWLGLAGLSLRHGGFPQRGPLQLGAAFLVGVGLWLYGSVHAGKPFAPGPVIHYGVIIDVAVIAQVLAILRKEAVGKRWGEHAAALFATSMLLSQASEPRVDVAAILCLGSATLLGFLAAQSATRISSGAWTFAATAATALVHAAWTFEHPGLAGDGSASSTALAIQLLTLLLFAFWPFVAIVRFRSQRWAWYAAALAGPAWFPSLKESYQAAFGEATIGLLPILLGAVSLAQARLAARSWRPADPMRKNQLAWFLAVALGFVTVAVPLQLEKEWVTIGWALEALAVTFLWKRLDHPGLKVLAVALFMGVTIRLVANEAVLGYYPRPSWRILNWLLYTYLVPAASMIWASALLRPREVARLRGWEQPLYAAGHPVGGIAVGLAAVAVIFVWINLAIADWFAGGETLRVSLERMPARDVATSISWAIYALALLALGVRGHHRGLRWLSLGLMMTAVIKVFLHDLGELEDLYRVGSLLGLAVSLILISLAYQRFVFGDAPAEES
jgi:hypothetical protein